MMIEVGGEIHPEAYSTQHAYVLMSINRKGIILVVYILSTGVAVPSSVLGIPTPFPASECVSPLGPKGGGEQHSLAIEEVGGPNADDWIESMALCILCAINHCVHTVQCSQNVYAELALIAICSITSLLLLIRKTAHSMTFVLSKKNIR